MATDKQRKRVLSLDERHDIAMSLFTDDQLEEYQQRCAKKENLAFDFPINKDAALFLLLHNLIYPHKAEIMCKEYGDDDDWVAYQQHYPNNQKRMAAIDVKPVHNSIKIYRKDSEKWVIPKIGNL